MIGTSAGIPGRAAARKNKTVRSRLPHGLKQAQGTGQVVGVVEIRARYGLAHVGVRREMHHRHGLVLAQRPRELSRLLDPAALERSPLDRVLMAARKIVVGDDPVARLVQALACVTADVAGSAGDQYCARHPSHDFSGNAGAPVNSNRFTGMFHAMSA